MIRTIDERISVAPQLAPEDMTAVAEAGFGLLICNRPEGEESSQPSHAAMRSSAEAAGLTFVSIPTMMGAITREQVDEMAQAISSTDKPVLAYCRSGTRSCNLWALAAATRGADAEELISKAAGAGYDLTGIRGILQQLSSQG